MVSLPRGRGVHSLVQRNTKKTCTLVEHEYNMALGVKHTHIALVCFYMASTTTHYLCGEMDSHYDVNTVVGQMRGYDV